MRIYNNGKSSLIVPPESIVAVGITGTIEIKDTDDPTEIALTSKNVSLGVILTRAELKEAICEYMDRVK